MLDALAQQLHAEATVGEVLDAAQALGWHEHMGDLSLQDLADALLEDEAAASKDEAAAAEGKDQDADDLEDEVDEDEVDEDEDEVDEVEDEAFEDFEDEDVEEPAPRSAKKKSGTKKASKKKTAKKTAKKAGAKKTSKKAGAKKTSKKAGAKKASKKAGAKKASKKAGATSKKSGKRGSFRGALDSRRLRALKSRVDADEPMSLDEAAELFVPLVEQMGQATMQDLEELTSIGRRKLRFHIGQLVRNGYLERNGMGRGTFYTAV